MILSTTIICGVLTTEQHTVAMAELQKSSMGPNAALFSDISDIHSDFMAKLCIRRRTYSKTAKLTAPCGIDRMNCAPAPLVNIFIFLTLAREDMVIRSPEFRLDCSRVFIVFAGWVATCAMDRETAPQIMFS
mmetsp:Transcript_15227/g.22295  ORF Transcript_15227/g.22295 Transcript_15227/m.22295 type:complete len:132 (-) Transcript_15227:63-458(-)